MDDIRYVKLLTYIDGRRKTLGIKMSSTTTLFKILEDTKDKIVNPEYQPEQMYFRTDCQSKDNPKALVIVAFHTRVGVNGNRLSFTFNNHNVELELTDTMAARLSSKDINSLPHGSTPSTYNHPEPDPQTDKIITIDNIPIPETNGYVIASVPQLRTCLREKVEVKGTVIIGEPDDRSTFVLDLVKTNVLKATYNLQKGPTVALGAIDDDIVSIGSSVTSVHEELFMSNNDKVMYSQFDIIDSLSEMVELSKTVKIFYVMVRVGYYLIPIITKPKSFRSCLDEICVKRQSHKSIKGDKQWPGMQAAAMDTRPWYEWNQIGFYDPNHNALYMGVIR